MLKPGKFTFNVAMCRGAAGWLVIFQHFQSIFISLHIESRKCAVSVRNRVALSLKNPHMPINQASQLFTRMERRKKKWWNLKHNNALNGKKKKKRKPSWKFELKNSYEILQLANDFTWRQERESDEDEAIFHLWKDFLNFLFHRISSHELHLSDCYYDKNRFLTTILNGNVKILAFLLFHTVKMWKFPYSSRLVLQAVSPRFTLEHFPSPLDGAKRRPTDKIKICEEFRVHAMSTLAFNFNSSVECGRDRWNSKQSFFVVFLLCNGKLALSLSFFLWKSLSHPLSQPTEHLTISPDSTLISIYSVGLACKRERMYIRGNAMCLSTPFSSRHPGHPHHFDGVSVPVLFNIPSPFVCQTYETTFETTNDVVYPRENVSESTGVTICHVLLMNSTALCDVRRCVWMSLSLDLHPHRFSSSAVECELRLVFLLFFWKRLEKRSCQAEKLNRQTKLSQTIIEFLRENFQPSS